MTSAALVVAGLLAALSLRLAVALNRAADRLADAHHERDRARAAAGYYRQVAHACVSLTGLRIDTDRTAASLAAASGDDLSAAELRAEACAG